MVLKRAGGNTGVHKNDEILPGFWWKLLLGSLFWLDKAIYLGYLQADDWTPN